MIATAKARYIRITPRKLRQVIPIVKGRPVEEAIAILASVNKRASIYIAEVLKSALENAKRLHKDIETSNIRISRLTADPGTMLKRYRAASMGRANTIRKHTSHLIAELDVIETPKPKPVATKTGAAKKMSRGRGK